MQVTLAVDVVAKEVCESRKWLVLNDLLQEENEVHRMQFHCNVGYVFCGFRWIS